MHKASQSVQIGLDNYKNNFQFSTGEKIFKFGIEKNLCLKQDEFESGQNKLEKLK